ncbi:MAG: hypothetical protein IJ713_01230 [Oscillibacter sp.]|nr:hypothetical protein [Oscillibacter sp.]
MDDEDKIREAEQIITVLAQQASYEIGDLLSTWSRSAWPICLSVMQSVINGLVAQMDEKDRKLFDHITAHTEMTMMPAVFDPRKKGRGK